MGVFLVVLMNGDVEWWLVDWRCLLMVGDGSWWLVGGVNGCLVVISGWELIFDFVIVLPLL